MATINEAQRETPDGHVRFWAGANWEGDAWNYNPRSGYQDVPPYILNHAYSFYSKLHVNVDAVDWRNKPSKEVRIIRPGDYRRNWDFGRRLDAVGPTK
ncbi:MAG: hypothetical protein ACT4NY_27180 [Pseudonocardiales bacterium]